MPVPVATKMEFESVCGADQSDVESARVPLMQSPDDGEGKFIGSIVVAAESGQLKCNFNVSVLQTDKFRNQSLGSKVRR